MKVSKVRLVAITACCAVLQVASANKYQRFEWERKTFVPFDATTTVTLECPDPAAAKWLTAHYKEWYGESAPTVKAKEKVAARGDARPPEDARPLALPWVTKDTLPLSTRTA